MAMGADGGRVLILDDDPNVGQLMAAIATRAGFSAEVTTAAAGFFDGLAQRPPTHIILDLVMPGIDGVEVLRRLAAHGCRARIIVASGIGTRVLDAAGRVAAENGLQIVGLLPKPFGPARLRELLAVAPAVPAGGQAALPAPVGGAPVVPAEPTVDALRVALAERRIQPHFQPKVACATRAVVGVECLARWIDPEAGIILPDRFIPLAEGAGLIAPLTRSVAEQALGWLAEAFPNEDLSLALNISALALEEEGLAEWIDAACQARGVAPQRVILEVTETSSMTNPVTMLELLTQFRLRGFQLSIDDFGVGFSSLVQLARLPFSEIKIDKTFVMTMPFSEESQKITAAIIGLGHALGLHVTAEGVETEWAMAFLADTGCDFAQGYLIGRPLEGADAARWIAARRSERPPP